MPLILEKGTTVLYLEARVRGKVNRWPLVRAESFIIGRGILRCGFE